MATAEYEWHDAARNRDVPVKIYYPATNTAPCPVIIFSHGLGGSREGYEYLGRHWASHGYVSVHPTHIGSDTSVLRTWQAMQHAAADLQNAIDRPKDVSFVIDQLMAISPHFLPQSSQLRPKRWRHGCFPWRKRVLTSSIVRSAASGIQSLSALI